MTGAADTSYMIRLASKCVGRWPSGASLILAPEADDPRAADRDDFTYGDDPDGLSCPFGAHVRRTHPRDVIKPYRPRSILSMSEAHRLLRRARVFGPPLFDPALLTNPANAADRKALLDLADDGQKRGIHFFCVNASIRSQFEFVQQNWSNNPRFGGLERQQGPDPRRQRANRPSAELHDHSRAPVPDADLGSAALRDRAGGRVPVHAQSGGRAVSGGAGRVERGSRAKAGGIRPPCYARSTCSLRTSDAISM